MTGKLEVVAGQYSDSLTSYAINLSNSNIVGVNSIYTADLSDNSQEGIHFYRTTTTVDSLWAKNGILYFTPNRTIGNAGAANYTILHSNNTYAANSNGTAVTITRNTDTTIATINGVAVKIKIPESDNTDTASAVDNILKGSNNGTAITYAPYTSQQSKLSFDTSTTAPSRTDRLNLNGYLYATKLYSNGAEVLTSHQSLSAYAPLNSPQFTGTPTAPTADTGTDTTQIATTAFVQSEIIAKLASNDAMLFKGIVDSTHSLPATHNAGWTYKVAANGTYAGKVCEIGDMIICTTDSTTANDDHWIVIQTNIDGAVTGPASATDNNIVLFNGTSGKIIKDSSKAIVTTTPTSSATDTQIPTSKAVWAAIGALDVSNISSNCAANKTLATLSETDGIIAATFQPIAISLTANATDGLWNVEGTNSDTTNTVSYSVSPYTTQQNKASFDNSNTAPSGTTRLNYNGYFYATKLYSGGTEVKTLQTAVTDNDANTTATLTFVKGITQNTNGVISVSKATLATVPIGQGGTNATSFTNKRLLYVNTDNSVTAFTSSGHYVDNTTLGINTTSMTSDYTLDINGNTYSQGNIIPSLNSGTANKTLGSSTNYWQSLYTDHVYIGDGSSQGNVYTPIYWNNGTPAQANKQIVYAEFSIASTKKGVKLTSTAFTADSQIVQLVITSNPEYLNGPLTATPANGYITIQSTQAVGGTNSNISGYIQVIRGAALATSGSDDDKVTTTQLTS